MVFKCVSQTNINGSFTSALVKDRDMGTLLGVGNQGGEFQFCNLHSLKNTYNI